MSSNRGALIVFEGVDRSGKSTQCRKLVETLKSREIPAELVVFPDRTTPIGKIIAQYLSNKEYSLHDKAIHMLFSANRWENVQKMLELLNKGVTLIVDRYAFSGIAYSAVKGGMDLDWCKSQDEGLPKPDQVYLLKLNQDEMKRRPGFGVERYEDQTTQMKVLEIYENLLDNSWETVDASGTVESVHDLLLGKILNVIGKVGSNDLKSLLFDRKIVKDTTNNKENDLNIMNTINGHYEDLSKIK